MRAIQSCPATVVLLLVSTTFLAGRGQAQEPTLDSLWADLADDNGVTAYRALWNLSLKAQEAVPFLKERVRPVTADRRHIDKLVRDLDSSVFAARDKAIAELQQLSDAAEEALKAALKENPSLEAKRRIDQLLKDIPEPGASPFLVRQSRALEALERIGAGDAMAVLEAMAGGNPAAHATRQAQAALLRIQVRGRSGPQMEAMKLDQFGDAIPAGTLARLGTVRMQNGDLAAFAPDGKTLVTVTDTTLHVWDVDTGREVDGFPQQKDWRYVRALAIAPNSKMLVVVYNSGHSFDVCKLPTGKLLHQQRGTGLHTDPGRFAVAFSADNETFVVTNQTKTQVWDAIFLKKIREYAQPHGAYSAAAVSPDAKRIATATSQKQRLHILDAASGEQLHDLGEQGGLIRACVFSAGGTKLAVSSDLHRNVCIWDARDGKRLREIRVEANPVHKSGPAPSFAFSPDGATLAMTDWVSAEKPEQRILLWNLADAAAKPRVLQPPQGIGWIESYSPDGRYLLYRVGNAFRLLDTLRGVDRHQWRSRGQIVSVAYSPDQKWIATGCHDGTVGLWDAVRASQVRILSAHRFIVSHVLFSPDSKTLITCGGENEAARLWDVATGNKRADLDNNENGVPGVLWAAFSPDSAHAFTSGLSVKHGVWNTETGKLEREFIPHRNSRNSVAYSPDLRYSASGHHSVSIDDLIAGKQKFHIPLKGELTALAFSPDGRMLAALNNRDDVIVWEVLTGKERARFPTARIGYSGRLAFSPDHRYLAVASPVFGEETLRVWDLATNKEVGPFPGHLGAVTNVAFSPNGRCLATASSDGTVLIRAFPGK